MLKYLIVLVLASAGCSKKSESGGGGGGGGGDAIVGACDTRAKENTCTEYRGTVATKDYVAKECTARGGTEVAACPKDGAVARCVQTMGNNIMHLVTYAPVTKETAAAMCNQPEMKLQDP